MSTTLHTRIESAIRTAKGWESDPSLLTEIRASIPFRELVPELVCHHESLWKSFLSSKEGESGEKGGKSEETVDAASESKTDDGGKESLSSSLLRDDDVNYEGDDLLLKRLTLYFKKEVMKWTNQPPCSNANCKGNEDGKQMESKGVRGPLTEEEKTGGAGRVEVYTCKLCNTETTFPRYNNPRTLFQSRRGRCGEFANLFGAYCRAIGYDTRYISDFTDHVWIEVWSIRQQRWIHADSCEGLIDRPNMYEQGWGKKLNYVVGATCDSVADVTKRYTRKFFSDEFQARRREFAPEEGMSDAAFEKLNLAVRQMSKMGKGRVEELDKRSKAEVSFFGVVQTSGVWDTEYREGRISGSLAWKAARNELGENNGNKKEESSSEEKKSENYDGQSFLVESFFPAPRDGNLEIVIQPPALSSPQMSGKSHPECIVVSGVPCAAAALNGISIVVVDELSGCILQSRAFSGWSSTGSFLDSVPDGRIIAICSISEKKEDNSAVKDSFDEATSKFFSRLGGFGGEPVKTQSQNNESSGEQSTGSCSMFIGQLGYHPPWAKFLQESDDSASIKASIKLDLPSSLNNMLRSEINTVPTIVSTRIPESIMPLRTQLEASNYQKRIAFQSFIENSGPSSSVVGYVTKADAPIYLIDNRAFPFRQTGGTNLALTSSDSSWITYHYLPDVIVPDEDIIMAVEDKNSSSNKNNAPKFDVPVADDYFAGLLGNQLLVKSGNSSTVIDTSSALANTRLVALYFSASWCGPCRSFTPMLIEFYNYLKEDVAPTHGLEIIFVSSDRDEAQFQQYYQRMPFKAMPFSNQALAQRVKSKFGVRGIPSLVVIDSMSGRIVVSHEDSRGEVTQACRMGEQAIERLFESWISKIPEESRAILEILSLSAAEADIGADGDSSKGGSKIVKNAKAESYLMRKKKVGQGKEDSDQTTKGLEKTEKIPAQSKEVFSERVKEIFSGLVANGLEPNVAAAKAIEQATAEQKQPAAIKLEEGALNGSTVPGFFSGAVVTVEECAETMCQLNSGEKTPVVNVLSTAKKYVSNVQKDPSNPRFRSFRLGNKVFDKITSTPGGIDLLTTVGFSFFHSDVDFVASIPLPIDLSMMSIVLDRLLDKYSS